MSVSFVQAARLARAQRARPFKLRAFPNWLVLIELLALTAVLIGALALRLPEIDAPVDNYDEGVYLQSLRLLALGYDSFTEIAASQGPLHLHTQLPFFLLFGQTVAAGRTASVAAALLVLVGAWWIGRQAGGRGAGLAAALLLLASPTLLRFSRQALADLPALAPATLAVGLALAYGRSGRRSLLVGAGLLLAVAVLMKPLVLPVALAVAVLVWRPTRAGWRDAGLVLGLVMLVVGLVLLLLGPAAVLDQVLGFRDEARAAYGWSPARNWELLVDKLDQEQPGFYALALAGLALLAARPGRELLAIALWAGASLLLLLWHSPLYYHHTIILLPPLAILGGLAIGAAPALLRGGWRGRIVGGLALASLLLYASGLPELARRDALLLENVDAAGEGSENVGRLEDAAQRIKRLAGPDDFVLTDHPYLTFLANRRVPPELVDLSDARLRAGDLTDEEITALAVAYNPRLVVLWEDKLYRLPRFSAWLKDGYREDRRYGVDEDGLPRAIYRQREVSAPR